jgi:hypothetical protein
VTDRGQSTVVGVALLVGVTVVSLGVLTATVGTVVESHAERADVSQVADGLADLRPARTTGPTTVSLAFTGGTLGTVSRDLRVLVNGSVDAHHEVDALLYEREDRSVVFLAGAVVRTNAGSAWFERGPPVTAVPDGGPGTLLVGAPVLVGDPALGGDADAVLRADVSHARRSLGTGRVAVAVETATPAPWAAYFEEQNATVTRTDLDGDGLASVVASFGRRETHLLVDRMAVSVDD